MTIEITGTTDLDGLIPSLRVHLWDIGTPPVYSDGFLKYALIAGLKTLMPRWNSRYIPSYNAATDNWDVTRNPQEGFPLPPPPVVMYGDERLIVLAAAIMLKSGKVYTSSFDTVSWKDDEVSYSNATGGKMSEASLLRDVDELNGYLPLRGKRLAQAKKQSLLGFRSPGNDFEG